MAGGAQLTKAQQEMVVAASESDPLLVSEITLWEIATVLTQDRRIIDSGSVETV